MAVDSPMFFRGCFDTDFFKMIWLILSGGRGGGVIVLYIFFGGGGGGLLKWAMYYIFWQAAYFLFEFLFSFV